MYYKLDKKQTGTKIRIMMMKRGFKTTELAHRLGYTDNSMLGRWMRGETTPSYEALVNLSVILRCNIKDLVHFDEV